MACMKTTISFCVCAFFVFLNYSVILPRVHTFWGDFFICAVSMLFSSILKIFLEPVRQNHYHYYFNNPKLVHHVFCSAPIYLFTFCVAFFSQFVWSNVVCLFFLYSQYKYRVAILLQKQFRKKGCCYSLQKQLFVYWEKKSVFLSV